MYSTLVAWGTLNSQRVASPLVRLVKGEERWNAPLTTFRVFFLKIGVGSRKIVPSPAWCSKLRLTIGLKNLALSRDEFRGPRFVVTVYQVG
ncbi:hypothetical protein TNCV_4733461 [Trichonephila clavipes]|nr:hypothetical protein TNCV_4733461 [Trichonephila clavipes]